MNCCLFQERFSSDFFLKHQLPEKTKLLYRAQDTANQVLKPEIFHCYQSSYINRQKGCKWAALQVYSKIYNIASVVSKIANRILCVPKLLVKGIYFTGNLTLGWAIRPLINILFPVNLINGKRHYLPIPKWIEKKWGECILYPSYTLSLSKTNERLSGTNERIAQKVNCVFHQIFNQNVSLLNPKTDWTDFNYQVMTASSSQNNAFCLPGGEVVVFSQIVKEMHESIQARCLKEAHVTFADGSKATVDLQSVMLEDVLAALLGHEMTHAAARHTLFH